MMISTYRYCPLCAQPLDDRQEGDRVRRHCARCGFVHYNNPVPAAGGIIQRDGAVCLVRRAYEPRKGYWSLPAGFMEYEEYPRQCAERELVEETGLTAKAEDLLGVYSGFDDPRQHAVLIVYWMAETVPLVPTPGDDAQEVAFFCRDELPPNIAFRAHCDALRDVFAHPRFNSPSY